MSAPTTPVSPPALPRLDRASFVAGDAAHNRQVFVEWLSTLAALANVPLDTDAAEPVPFAGLLAQSILLLERRPTIGLALALASDICKRLGDPPGVWPVVLNGVLGYRFVSRPTASDAPAPAADKPASV